MQLQYLDDGRRSYAACANVPEFKFSPKAGKRIKRTFVCDKPDCEMCAPNPPQQGPMKPMLKGGNPVKVGPERQVGAIEKGWLNYIPFFKTKVNQTTKPPVGTVPTLEGLGHFLSRVDEINAIAETQFLDLPTVQQELAAMGVSSINLSSSPNDSEDDDYTLEIAEPGPESTRLEGVKEFKFDKQANHDARRYGTPYVTADLAAVMRRIEWERGIIASKLPVRVVLHSNGEAVGPVSASSDHALVNELFTKLYAACGRPGPKTTKDLMNFADYYGYVGSKFYTPQEKAESLEQSMDDLGAEDLMDPEEILQGPQELGMHWLSSDLGDEWMHELGLVLAEPAEYELWPEESGLGER